MSSQELRYAINTAEENDIFIHLKECNDYFIPYLDETVNIASYSKKIFYNAVKFEVWDKEFLVGILAVYLNNLNNRIGYITNISVLNKYSRRGIASNLIKNCIKYAAKKNFKEIVLEVNNGNESAINLYRKFRFTEISKNSNNTKMSLTIIKSNQT
jgi:ribosomal protein S18 acetylase RimI-like enzyme